MFLFRRFMVLLPNSTPMVVSWSNLNFLSKNCIRIQDLPTPIHNSKGNTRISNDDELKQISVPTHFVIFNIILSFKLSVAHIHTSHLSSWQRAQGRHRHRHTNVTHLRVNILVHLGSIYLWLFEWLFDSILDVDVLEPILRSGFSLLHDIQCLEGGLLKFLLEYEQFCILKDILDLLILCMNTLQSSNLLVNNFRSF